MRIRKKLKDIERKKDKRSKQMTQEKMETTSISGYQKSQ